MEKKNYFQILSLGGIEERTFEFKSLSDPKKNKEVDKITLIYLKKQTNKKQVFGNFSVCLYPVNIQCNVAFVSSFVLGLPTIT